MGIWSQIFGKKTPKQPATKAVQTKTPEVSELFATIAQPNVQDSHAHVLLLTKFVTPNIAEHVLKDYWTSALGEHPTFAFSRLKSAGLIVEANLQQKIVGSQTVASLKLLLKELGASTYGNKDALAERLAANHSEIAKEKFSHFDVWVCTEGGKRIAQKYLDDQSTRRQTMCDRCVKALRSKNVMAAAEEVKAFEAAQIFSRGTGIDWKNVNIQELAAKISGVMSSRPKIVKGLDEAEFEELAIGAAMMALLGENNGSQWVGEPLKVKVRQLGSLDVDTRARMMLFHASNGLDLQNLRNAGIKHVKVHGANDSCPECQKLHGKRFALAQVPCLPHENCSHRYGCRCCIVAEHD